MSYVRGVLQPGEHIRFETKIHWAIYVPGILLVALAVAALIFGHTSVAIGALLIWQIIAAILFIAGAGFLLWAWFRRWITEIAVTDRRIIYKYGFIRRRTIEMHLDKVESVDVEQSILGRILNYGDIIIRGVGVGIEPLQNIEYPIEFRNHVTAEPTSAPSSAPAKAP